MPNTSGGGGGKSGSAVGKSGGVSNEASKDIEFYNKVKKMSPEQIIRNLPPFVPGEQNKKYAELFAKAESKLIASLKSDIPIAMVRIHQKTGDFAVILQDKRSYVASGYGGTGATGFGKTVKEAYKNAREQHRSAYKE